MKRSAPAADLCLLVLITLNITRTSVNAQIKMIQLAEKSSQQETSVNTSILTDFLNNENMEVAVKAAAKSAAAATERSGATAAGQPFEGIKQSSLSL